MNNRKLYFDVPTQVAFWEDNHYIGGIAYGAEIICSCCGGVVEIAEVYEFAPEGVNPVVEYRDWIPFDAEILHDDEQFFEWEGAEDKDD